jgi:hypothetical protein
MTPIEYLGKLRKFLMAERPHKAIAFARTTRRSVSPTMTRDQKREAATLLEHALMLQDPSREDDAGVVVCPPSPVALLRTRPRPTRGSQQPVEPWRPGS